MFVVDYEHIVAYNQVKQINKVTDKNIQKYTL